MTVPLIVPRTRSQPAPSVEPAVGRTTISALITAQKLSGRWNAVEIVNATTTAIESLSA